MTGKYWEDYIVGEKFQTTGRLMTDADIRLFIGCSDNTFPIHVDPEYCAKFPGVGKPVVQGVLVLGVADGFMAREGLQSPNVSSMHYGHDKVRYLRPTYPGDTIWCSFELMEKRDKNEQFGLLKWNVTVYNQNNEAVLFHEDLIYKQKRSAL